MTSAKHRLLSGRACTLQFKAQLNVQAFFFHFKMHQMYFYFFITKNPMLNGTFSETDVGF